MLKICPILIAALSFSCAPRQHYRHALTYPELHATTILCQQHQDAERYEEFLRTTFVRPEVIDTEIAYLTKQEQEMRVDEFADYTRPFAVSFTMRATNALKKYKAERT